MLSESFMSETANLADLILPASFTIETEGSFTNTQRFIQQFTKQTESKVERTLIEQLSDLLNKFGIEQSVSANDIMMETVSLFPNKEEKISCKFHTTDNDNFNRIFDYGCDYLNKKFMDSFNKAFEE